MFAFGLRVTLAKGGRGPNKSGVVRTFFEKKKKWGKLIRDPRVCFTVFTLSKTSRSRIVIVRGFACFI